MKATLQSKPLSRGITLFCSMLAWQQKRQPLTRRKKNTMEVEGLSHFFASSPLSQPTRN